jgi:hypothetical protein
MLTIVIKASMQNVNILSVTVLCLLWFAYIYKFSIMALRITKARPLTVLSVMLSVKNNTLILIVIVLTVAVPYNVLCSVKIIMC